MFACVVHLVCHVDGKLAGLVLFKRCGMNAGLVRKGRGIPDLSSLNSVKIVSVQLRQAELALLSIDQATRPASQNSTEIAEISYVGLLWWSYKHPRSISEG